nr:DUF2510 domain-containing protein [uncultured Rhodococcus sp.]
MADRVDDSGDPGNRDSERGASNFQHLWSTNAEKPTSSASQSSSRNSAQLPPPGWYPNPAAPGQRWWDGRQWTDAAVPQAIQPRKPPSSVLAGPRARWAFGGGVIAALIVAALAYTLTARDDDSYQAGYEYGTDQGGMYTSLTSDRASDVMLRINCGTAATLAADDGVYWSGGRLEGGDIDRDDYQDGCFDAYRSIAPG